MVKVALKHPFQKKKLYIATYTCLQKQSILTREEMQLWESHISFLSLISLISIDQLMYNFCVLCTFNN